jgi:hypothetical protein
MAQVQARPLKCPCRVASKLGFSDSYILKKLVDKKKEILAHGGAGRRPIGLEKESTPNQLANAATQTNQTSRKARLVWL